MRRRPSSSSWQSRARRAVRVRNDHHFTDRGGEAVEDRSCFGLRLGVGSMASPFRPCRTRSGSASRDAGPRRPARAARPRPARSARGVGRTPSGPAKARIRPMSAAGKASVSRSARMAMYCAVHSPMPGRASAARSPPRGRRGAGRARDRRPPRAARPAIARAARPRHPEGRRCRRPARRSGVGKTMGQAARRPPAGLAVAAASLPARRVGGADGDLLAENGADRELEAVPGAGRAQARPRATRREREDRADRWAPIAADRRRGRRPAAPGR